MAMYMPLQVGDMVDTPYGTGVVIEADKSTPQNVVVNVRGTDFRIKQIGMRAIGFIDIP